jgi:hypothetical protein
MFLRVAKLRPNPRAIGISGDISNVWTAKNQLARFSLALPPQAICLAVVAAMLTILPGCGGVEEAKLEDYLEQLDYSKPMESLAEVQLGDYRVSSAASKQDGPTRETGRTWVQITCKLYVIVAPENVDLITKAYERHRGMFDDAIVQIFRSATVDELTDPRWSALKSRLADFARPILGEDRVHQIVINDYGWEPI